MCNAKHVSLTSNFRNSENVVNTSDAIGWKLSYTTKNYLVPCKNIVGPTNFYYKNDLQFDNASLAIAAIKKYFSSDLNEPVVILLEDPDHLERFCCFFKKQYTERKIIKLSTCDETKDLRQELHSFITKSEGILITNIQTFNGMEARNIIIYNQSKTNDVLRNLILRAVSVVIFICNNNIHNAIRSVPGLTEDTNLDKHIPKSKLTVNYFETKNPYDEEIIISAVKKIQQLSCNSLVILVLKGNGKRVEETVSGIINMSIKVLEIDPNDLHDHLFLDKVEETVSGIIKRNMSIKVFDLHDFFFLDKADNIVILTKRFLKVFNNFCRNVILRAQPSLTLIVHDENTEKFNHLHYNEITEINQLKPSGRETSSSKFFLIISFSL